MFTEDSIKGREVSKRGSVGRPLEYTWRDKAVCVGDARVQKNWRDSPAKTVFVLHFRMIGFICVSGIFQACQ